MTAQEVLKHWNAAKPGRSFLDFLQEFERSTGIRQDDVTRLFVKWNRIPQEEAEAIALKHGTTLREGGFQAFLVEKLGL
jgi:hypothetical protein